MEGEKAKRNTRGVRIGNEGEGTRRGRSEGPERRMEDEGEVSGRGGVEG